MASMPGHPSNPFVFVVGCTRSGTTVLRRMLEAHPEMAFPPETHWLVEPFQMGARWSPEEPVSGGFAAWLIEHKRFRRMELEARRVLQLVAGEPIAYPEFVSRIFDLFGERENKALVGDKTPSYVRWVPLLHELWPRSKFLHIVRDGRDVCLSLMSWKKAENASFKFGTWDADPATTSALRWEWSVRLGREAGARLGPELYREVRYEALVNDPESECRAICDWLGVAFSHDMLRFHEGKTKAEPGLDAKSAWMPVTSGLRDWRTQMQAADLEKVEAVAGGLLEELGYERGSEAAGSEALESVEELRAGFVDDARLRARPLPEAWLGADQHFD